MFTGNGRIYTNIEGGTQVFLVNIALVRKNLPMTNTLAYFASPSATKNFFVMLAPIVGNQMVD